MFLFLFVEPYMWFVVNIHLLPDGLNEYQLQSFIAHNMLSNLPFYLATYIPVASSWISHYRIITYREVL